MFDPAHDPAKEKDREKEDQFRDPAEERKKIGGRDGELPELPDVGPDTRLRMWTKRTGTPTIIRKIARRQPARSPRPL